uniref:F-box domain-containing protein n=1 Tax=Gossypium raimondii TaxID=29730 RepID=A0A0D2VSL5_GOSRA|nr:hypothetical protein B456_011G278200 [Gossypium raimondii]
MKRPRFELSEALMKEILSKLPVKSLTRFNCVCKYWCSSFRTPHFVSKHYHNNLKNNNVNLLLQQHVAKTYTHLKILLPPLVRRPPSRGYLTLQHVMYNDAAFGFDSETDNYKFIRFVTLNFDSEQEISDFRFASQVELYSLKSDSWKEISLPNFDIPQLPEWEAWTKQFSIESVPEVSHSLELWITGELFLTSTNNEIVLLDLSTQELKKLRIDTCPKCLRTLHIPFCLC